MSSNPTEFNDNEDDAAPDYSIMTDEGHSDVDPIPSTSDGETKPEDGSNLYEVLSSNTTHSQKFHTRITQTSIRLKEIQSDPEDWIRRMFDSILEKELKDVDSRDRVGVVLNNTTFTKPLYITLRKRDQLTTDVILAEAEKVIQSNENFFLNEPLDVKISVVHLPSGQGRKQNGHGVSFDTFCQMRSRSIVIIKNDVDENGNKIEDKLCLPRAIIVGKAFVENSENLITNGEYTQIKENKSIQRDMATALCREAIPECEEDYENIINFKGDLEDVDKFQQYLKNTFEITVFCGSDRTGRKVLYKGNTGNTRFIDLILEDNHYNVITTLTGAFAVPYYCRRCNKGYHHKYDHRCQGRCKNCCSITPCEPQEDFNKKCKDCNIYFQNVECFNRHKVLNRNNNTKSICDVTKYCYNCQQMYTLSNKKLTHKCWYKICKLCQDYVPKDHLCYIQKLKDKKSYDIDEDTLLVFFDFEARVENGVHIPNFCVLQHHCSECINLTENIEEKCDVCGQREYFFDKEGDDLLDEMFKIIGMKSQAFKRVLLLAHNGSGYDFQFITKYIIMKKHWTPKIIKNGSKIMSIEFRNFCFKDTLYFFGCKLAALPDMFDIKEEVKGYFPHHFNLPENSSYIGPLPEPKDYGVDYMTDEEKKKFEEWYKLWRHLEFNFKEEMKKYCKSDVDILRKATLKFTKLFRQLMNVNPLESAITIASACMQGYRRNFLPANTIGVMDFKTYHMRDKQSKKALRYLLYLEKIFDTTIQSAYRGMEKQFGAYKVDGYIDNFPTSKLKNFNKSKDSRDKVPVIIEFQGCLFHGCVKCYSEEERHNPLGDTDKTFETLHHRYENTKKKMEYLKRLPCKPYILEVWECEIRQECTRDTILNHFMTDPEVLIRIESNREAFFGGRTECFRKYYKVQIGEQIRYIDVNSLYPYVNKYGIYPVGHPEIYIDEAAQQLDLSNTTGIAKVKILPPRRLYFPILPIKMNKKLMFILCRSCAETGNSESCNHIDEEREFVGTYTCIELKEALQNGYEVKNVYEVWSYQSTQYDKEKNTGGIFAEYINKFLKIKQAASNFPPNVKTEAEKLEFCRKFKEKENIDLEPSEVQKNPGLRSLSKLCLNSLWGKFGQRNNMAQTTITDKMEKFTEIMVNVEKEITDVDILKKNFNNRDDDIMLVSWRYVDECAADTTFINPVVSAYVTAQARLYLFSFLQRVGDKALYCDTDSIIYIHREGDPEIETGPYLGDMGNEMDDYTKEYGPGCYIDEFVCEGPKNYSYRVVNGEGKYVKTITKIRGFTLNYASNQHLNFTAMKEFVTGENAMEISVTEPFKIQRRSHYEVITKAMTKEYNHIPCKRRCIDNFQTEPFGY